MTKIKKNSPLYLPFHILRIIGYLPLLLMMWLAVLAFTHLPRFYYSRVRPLLYHCKTYRLRLRHQFGQNKTSDLIAWAGMYRISGSPRAREVVNHFRERHETAPQLVFRFSSLLQLEEDLMQAVDEDCMAKLLEEKE
ncbi:MAG: hypothetical protein ACLFT3_19810, partial [Cyclobacteriaceae bacterium]